MGMEIEAFMYLPGYYMIWLLWDESDRLYRDNSIWLLNILFIFAGSSSTLGWSPWHPGVVTSL